MAESRAAAPDRDRVQRDIGTPWMLKRGESTARCVLLALADGLELQVLMDGDLLRAERCERYEQAFALADRWRTRMMDRGWTCLRS